MTSGRWISARLCFAKPPAIAVLLGPRSVAQNAVKCVSCICSGAELFCQSLCHSYATQAFCPALPHPSCSSVFLRPGVAWGVPSVFPSPSSCAISSDEHTLAPACSRSACLFCSAPPCYLTWPPVWQGEDNLLTLVCC